MKQLCIALAALALLFGTTPGDALAEARKLDASEIAEALTGNTVEGLWGQTPYRSDFDSNGLTLYKPQGRPADRGRWKVDKTSHQYCSWWERSGWSCYDLYRDGDTIIWGIPGTSTRYPSALLEGKQL